MKRKETTDFGILASKRVNKRIITKKIVEFPPSASDVWRDPDSFHEALDLHMSRHRDSAYHLHRAMLVFGIRIEPTTLRMWRRGLKCPYSVNSLKILGSIERRYRLPAGYFKSKLSHPARALHRPKIPGVSSAEQRRLSWHLPDDFAERSLEQQQEILEWVRRVVISGATEYRKYHASRMRERFAVRFPGLDTLTSCGVGETHEELASIEPERLTGTVEAPAPLAAEMADLIRFKTSTLTPLGYQRNGVWGDETADQKIEHLGLLFGALVASPRGVAKGYGANLRSMTFAILAFPTVWDFYLQWRHQRRGFFTAWEVDMLCTGAALTRPVTGWLRQSPNLAKRLSPIEGLIGTADIALALQNWDATCDRLHKFAGSRVKEIQRVVRVHRDPFEPILPILEAANPVAEYKKIADEILRLMPDERRYPVAAAESMRALLMIRLGLHSGIRQKNLRQLLFRERGQAPSPDKHLIERKRGELRWNEREEGWEVLIPAIAFKNVKSSFFGNNHFRLMLPNLAGLYAYIDSYLGHHRARLLKGRTDPGTFFVKTAKASTVDASYDQNSFYDAWRLIIQRFGIYNPFTKRGAIPGLLPHGPHNVRDVLATHILKLTGSFEQASYSIQDTPDMVAKHYGRFLPQDKTALAANILNRVWEAA